MACLPCYRPWCVGLVSASTAHIHIMSDASQAVGHGHGQHCISSMTSCAKPTNTCQACIQELAVCACMSAFPVTVMIKSCCIGPLPSSQSHVKLCRVQTPSMSAMLILLAAICKCNVCNACWCYCFCWLPVSECPDNSTADTSQHQSIAGPVLCRFQHSFVALEGVAWLLYCLALTITLLPIVILL